jgi:hypothetical protein
MLSMPKNTRRGKQVLSGSSNCACRVEISLSLALCSTEPPDRCCSRKYVFHQPRTSISPIWKGMNNKPAVERNRVVPSSRYNMSIGKLHTSQDLSRFVVSSSTQKAEAHALIFHRSLDFEVFAQRSHTTLTLTSWSQPTRPAVGPVLTAPLFGAKCRRRSDLIYMVWYMLYKRNDILRRRRDK